MSPSLSFRVPSALALGALCLASVGEALADTAVGVPATGTVGAAASPIVTLSKMLGALALVLLVFWGCARLMRRLNGAGAALGGQGGLRVVGGLSLGHRERLVLVQAGDEQLLLGVTAQRIERLHRLERPLERPGPASARSPDFRARLREAMGRGVPS